MGDPKITSQMLYHLSYPIPRGWGGDRGGMCVKRVGGRTGVLRGAKSTNVLRLPKAFTLLSFPKYKHEMMPTHSVMTTKSTAVGEGRKKLLAHIRTLCRILYKVLVSNCSKCAL